MTIPGRSLFYAGLVRDRNVLSVLVHCFALTCIMSVLWLIIGYSLSFSGGNAWIGDLDMLGIQLTGIAFTVIYTVIVTFLILKIVSMITGGLRVTASDEEQGLDFTSHGETGYNS